MLQKLYQAGILEFLWVMVIVMKRREFKALGNQYE